MCVRKQRFMCFENHSILKTLNNCMPAKEVFKGHCWSDAVEKKTE